MHAPAIGVRTRLVKALDPAIPAKQMFGLARAEPVCGKVFPAAQQDEPIVRNDQVEKAGRRTDRAIAIEQLGGGFALRREANRAAVAPAIDRDEAGCAAHSPVTDFARLRGWSTSVPLTPAT